MKFKLKFTVFQKGIEVISAIVLLALICYIALNWASVPDRIPSHFNGSGVADAWTNKSFIVFLPIVCTLLYALLTTVSFFPTTWNVPVRITEENKIAVYNATRDLLCMIKLELTVGFAYIIVCTLKVSNLGKLFLPIFLMTIFGTIIGSIVRSQKFKESK